MSGVLIGREAENLNPTLASAGFQVVAASERPSGRPAASSARTATAFGGVSTEIAVSSPDHGRDATTARWSASGPASTCQRAIPRFPFQLAYTRSPSTDTSGLPPGSPVHGSR